APITSQSKKYPTRIPVKHNSKKGWVVLDQIRTIDKQRIIKTLDNLTEKEIEEVKLKLQETYID
ncbi:MAG: type II toxin-antitoxin system PemK/MazF family toxin, partial [Desulfonauticus sp.]|nr:type II toxin-antitoxin system PemK/MazF family toxin [Desulfonauticus sp.]